MSDQNVSARRVRQVRARRWLRGLRAFASLVLIVAVPVFLAILLTSGEDSTSSTTVSEPAEVLVRSFDGSGSTSTGVFVVSAGWILKWQLDGLASDSIEIVVREAGGRDFQTSLQEGIGAGERFFEQGGAYRLVVTSTGDWNIRVLQTTQISAP